MQFEKKLSLLFIEVFNFQQFVQYQSSKEDNSYLIYLQTTERIIRLYSFLQTTQIFQNSFA